MPQSHQRSHMYSMASLERAFPQFAAFVLIAETNFSAVFSVESRVGGPRLALKLARTGGHDELLLRKFDDEYRLLSSLLNDHLVLVTAYGRSRIHMANGDLVLHNWYAMHLCEGGSVLSKLSTLNLRTRIAIVDQMLVGLSYLHQKGIAHRDIKPHNLFLAGLSPLEVKIGDFGIAKGLDPKASDANSRIVGGTPQYMAPERMQAAYIQQPSPDWRPSDQYAAGVTAYQILSAGASPLHAGEPGWGHMGWEQIQQVHLTRPLRALEIPDAHGVRCKRTDQVIGRMMALDPRDRYPNMNECRRSLTAALISDSLMS